MYRAEVAIRVESPFEHSFTVWADSHRMIAEGSARTRRGAQRQGLRIVKSFFQEKKAWGDARVRLLQADEARGRLIGRERRYDFSAKSPRSSSPAPRYYEASAATLSISGPATIRIGLFSRVTLGAGVRATIRRRF